MMLGYYDNIDKNGSTLLKLSIAPSASILVDSIPYLRSLVGLKLYDNSGEQDGSMMMCWILYSGISGLDSNDRVVMSVVFPVNIADGSGSSLISCNTRALQQPRPKWFWLTEICHVLTTKSTTYSIRHGSCSCCRLCTVTDAVTQPLSPSWSNSEDSLSRSKTLFWNY